MLLFFRISFCISVLFVFVIRCCIIWFWIFCLGFLLFRNLLLCLFLFLNLYKYNYFCWVSKFAVRNLIPLLFVSVCVCICCFWICCVLILSIFKFCLIKFLGGFLFLNLLFFICCFVTVVVYRSAVVLFFNAFLNVLLFLI